MKMKKLCTILFDQDGVLANYTKAHCEAIAREFPELPRLRPEEATCFNTEDHFPPEYRARIEALTLRPGFFLNLEPLPGAIEALRTLLALGFDVRICTSPKKIFDNCVAEKFAWLKKHLGEEFVERIVLTRDKTLVQGDILVDDKPHITGICTPTWKHILYDQPYNREHISQPRLTWANYQEVLGT